ncbi:MAG TPA: glycosyl hydrolase, partial [Chitinophagaceae bacterium]|nr:glycosyl hydrolase [Chitinophagaceae bacterium]
KPVFVGAFDPTYRRMIDITKNVDADGKLNWKSPADGWNVCALYEGLHGKMVERAAPGGEGYAIDHFSSAAAKNYFKRFDSAFKGYDISYLRGLFNDSYEVDDARGQANWTSNFFNEFKKRKGYDLRTVLPDLLGMRDSLRKCRTYYDYRSVIDELLLENFTMEWKKWGSSKGKILRNQSHGSPANTLDLYGVVDIPETEGIDILRFKFASSAANVMGKKLVAAESATWLNEHFLSSWGDVKKAIDLYFLGGVNHIVYHGTAYSPQEAAWPGWLFYAAVHFQPNNPQWKDFHTLNEYITRVQSFLQTGRPDNDVLVYYPIADRYNQPGPVLLQHFDGMEKNFEGTEFEHVSKWMLEKGYGFDFISDRQLLNVKTTAGKLNSGGNPYRTVLLPANQFIPEKSFRQLIALAEQGNTILVYKKMPADIPGVDITGKGRTTFKQLLKRFKFATNGALQTATIGKGRFIISDDMNALIQAAGARKEQLAEKGLSVIRRKNDNGIFYFVNNRGTASYSGWVKLDDDAASIVLFDAMTGEHGTAKTRKNSEGKTEVYLQLRSFESIIIQSYKKEQSDLPFRYLETTGSPIPITGTWTITFTNGGPVTPSVKTIDKPGSWTDLDGDDVKNYSGSANYFIDFEKPAGHTGDWLLDLGKVNETAEVRLNNTTIATLVGPVFQCVIPAKALKQTNKLEIVVSSLMANRISYMDRNNLPWKIFYNTNMPARKRENVKNGLFDASAWKPLPSGLSGPVTITALR